MLNDRFKVYYDNQLSSLSYLEKWENGVVKQDFLEKMTPVLHNKLLVGGWGEGVRKIQTEGAAN